MSFGSSISDIALLIQLAYKTTQGARAACGEYDELTRETSSLHIVLNRLHAEVTKPEGSIDRRGGTYGQELSSIASGCEDVLTQLDKILVKYNALSEQERSARRLWKKIRFGSGVVADVAELRSRVTYYTSALSVLLNLISLGTVGEVEEKMDRAGGDLKDIKIAVNSITARLMATAGHEGSVMTAYTNDDRDAWRELRRGLASDGFSDSLIRKHKKKIIAYVKELGNRGILDTDGADEFEGRASMSREQDSGSKSTVLNLAASVLENSGAESNSDTSPLSRGPLFDSSKDTTGSRSANGVDAGIALSTLNGELKPSHRVSSIEVFSKDCTETRVGESTETTSQAIQPEISARHILMAREPSPERQRLDEPKHSSRHAYFDSGSETENEIIQEHSSRETIRSSGKLATSTNPGPLPDDVGRSGSKDSKPAPIPIRETESTRDCHNSISDDNGFNVDFDGGRRGREHLTEDNLDYQNRRNFSCALPQPSLTSQRYPLIVSDHTVFDPFNLARKASFVLEHFRSKIVYLLTMGLPQSDTIAVHEHKETIVRHEDLVLLDGFARSGANLLLGLLYFLKPRPLSAIWVPGYLNSYGVETVTASCVDAIKGLEPRIVYGKHSCGLDQKVFYDSTIKSIEKWNNDFDDAYHTTLGSPERTCHNLTDRQKCIKYCHGRLRPTGICRVTRVYEWDDGYNGVKGAEHWFPIQEMRDPISKFVPVLRRSQTMPFKYKDL